MFLNSVRKKHNTEYIDDAPNAYDTENVHRDAHHT